ncbi:hypothetical protein AM501_26985 [Aneurinibacillus migulanus]|uniref:histidine kinase n=1 Tax=Aneurinibacillus migulanus TaxID=47500 RepID=A0A0D1VA33_ANEMI|nr:ATP-binding protein [Aneurinibacillus migulanus]KIV56274.1 hypothetical protein TS65_13780 [Aneurinibacillus migulanus]KIV57000.1 hypothetical protein TS64_08190 [Aneurinibacillus migulanus]KON84345.1 hypothetical protein AF333_30930 [Aneurinibacillus migulanus]KPD05217.1 hypothetical protein AM501_26985 [Aneurinibacillus migulanus]MCP1359176.1 ATP-binding protein [Aneurinibacillus migulanus]
MNVIDGINQILLQVFLILFPILLYHLYWGENDLLEDKRKSRFAYGLLSTVSIVLCMIFTFPISNGYLLDLRTVPLLISFLYGGYRSGIFVTVVFLGYRYYLGGGGFFVPLIVCSFLVPCLIAITPRYQSCSTRYRVFLAAIIALGTSILIATVTYMKMAWSDIQIDKGFSLFFAGYTTIQTFTMWVTVYLIEGLKEKALIQHQLRQSDKLNVMSELVASVAHEIRNPLTVVRGFMQLFDENRKIPEEVKPYIGLVIKEIDRTQEIITDFLSFAKPKLEKVERFSVAEQIRYVTSLMSSYATLQNVHMKLFIADCPYIETDPDKFNQILINIMKNGIEAMPRGGELEVNLRETNGIAEICVNDQGVGMTEEEVKRLGTLFYSTKTKGTGIGLLVSYRLIEKMNGEVEVRSRKGNGTQFIIKLPMVTEK